MPTTKKVIGEFPEVGVLCYGGRVPGDDDGPFQNEVGSQHDRIHLAVASPIKVRGRRSPLGFTGYGLRSEDQIMVVVPISDSVQRDLPFLRKRARRLKLSW